MKKESDLISLGQSNGEQQMSLNRKTCTSEGGVGFVWDNLRSPSAKIPQKVQNNAWMGIFPRKADHLASKVM